MIILLLCGLACDTEDILLIILCIITEVDDCVAVYLMSTR